MRFFLVLSFIGIVLFTGCSSKTQPSPLYTWDDYVRNSTDYGMHQGDKKYLQKYMATLKRIIDESENSNKRVAPGIYAEYASLLYQTHKKEEAKRYFLLEKKTYPESTIFIDRVMIKLYGSAK